MTEKVAYVQSSLICEHYLQVQCRISAERFLHTLVSQQVVKGSDLVSLAIALRLQDGDPTQLYKVADCMLDLWDDQVAEEYVFLMDKEVDRLSDYFVSAFLKYG